MLVNVTKCITLPFLYLEGKCSEKLFESYSNSHHIIISMFPAQKGRGMFEDTLRVLSIPKGDDPLGDVAELHHLRHATSALSRSRHR